MTELLDLCYDVLIRILEEINPSDIAACARTCSAFHHFIRGNAQLHKTHYLKNFDDPRKAPTDSDPQWVPELQSVIRCQKILESADNDLKRDEFSFVAFTVSKLISTASMGGPSGTSQNQELLSRLFLQIFQNHNAFLCRSSLYPRAGTENQNPADNEEDRQQSAKLHCLFGIPTSNIGRRTLGKHPYARARVYDLRNYTEKTRWGPFRQDGSFRVDWEMMESLMILLGFNAGMCCRRFQLRFSPPWTEPLQGVIPEKIVGLQDYPAKLLHEPDLPRSMKDPFNVTGVWSRIVCFLDYNDLYNYNFGVAATDHPPGEPRAPLTTEEAIRHIIMDLKVTHIAARDQVSDDDEEFDIQKFARNSRGHVKDNRDSTTLPILPVVYFEGTSRSVDASWDPNANSKIKGSVRVTNEGEVRWKTISIFHGGEERWRSEGVQVGGPKSQRGVVGTWFDKDFDRHGPAGPTAFWKISDRNLDDGDSGSDEDAVVEPDEIDVHFGTWSL